MSKPPETKKKGRFGRFHLTKYLTERDTIFATIWVFIFIFALGSIPLNLYVLNPIKLALKDFDFNDLAYSQLDKGTDSLERRIVIINIGKAGRGEIAQIIEKTAALNPKVIGLDATFSGERDPLEDSMLAEAFRKHRNVVGAQKLDWYDDSLGQVQVETVPGFYDNEIAMRGYANLNKGNKDTGLIPTGTIRFYSAFEHAKDTVYEHFTTAIVRQYDQKAYARLKAKKKKGDVQINYSRRLEQYHVIDKDDILFERIEGKYLEGKIALLGYVSYDPYDMEDRKFTPFNHKFVGRAVPDMNGIIVQANIISMVLDGQFIKKVPSWLNWLLAAFICWLHMSFFIRYYLEDHIWFHLVAKIAQVASAILFVYLGIYVFDRFGVKLDMKYSLICIALAVDVIYFYEAWAVWMHKKFHYKTLFHHHSHH